MTFHCPLESSMPKPFFGTWDNNGKSCFMKWFAPAIGIIISFIATFDQRCDWSSDRWFGGVSKSTTASWWKFITLSQMRSHFMLIVIVLTYSIGALVSELDFGDDSDRMDWDVYSIRVQIMCHRDLEHNPGQVSNPGYTKSLKIMWRVKYFATVGFCYCDVTTTHYSCQPLFRLRPSFPSGIGIADC